MNFLFFLWYKTLLFFRRVVTFYYLFKIERLKDQNEKLRNEILKRKK